MIINTLRAFYFIFISYAIVIVQFVDAQQRNYLVLIAAIFGGFWILIFGLKYTSQLALALGLVLCMLISIVYTQEISNLSSIALTVLFATGYFAISALLDRIPNQYEFVIDLLRKLIISLSLVSILQMITSLAGLPTPNVYGVVELWSYPSLSMEPSHLGRTASISFLAFLVLIRFRNPQKSVRRNLSENCVVILSFITTIALSGSSLAFLASIFVLIAWRSIAYALALTILIALILSFLPSLNIEPTQRAFAFLQALKSFDISTISVADHSASIRVIPALIFLDNVSLFDNSFWFGGGRLGLDQLLLGNIPGTPEDFASAGFIPGFIVVYGSIVTGLFILSFVVLSTNRKTFPIVVFWMIFMTFSAWNTQVFWYGLVILKIVHKLTNQRNHRTIGAPL